ncbi:MAG: dTDP-4-dehydrorhamnose 3,5-epimerase, partial [Wenzhouxiangellaceae bacterium]|nr:dTDP-4-dehydrorhamnose 3,5-epimerase [Wenzhouxiangellaceae bacterium]
MKAVATGLEGVRLLEPQVFGDARGWFLENWREETYSEAGIDATFRQANTSRSRRGVLRGIHYQWPEPQGKLVWVSEGTVFDVAVDLRRDSDQFGRWTGFELGADNHRQLWIPEGFGHGFQVLSETATFSYLCTRPYRPEHDACVAWNDPRIGIDWPMEPTGMSERDGSAPGLDEIDSEQLPRC